MHRLPVIQVKSWALNRDVDMPRCIYSILAGRWGERVERVLPCTLHSSSNAILLPDKPELTWRMRSIWCSFQWVIVALVVPCHCQDVARTLPGRSVDQFFSFTLLPLPFSFSLSSLSYDYHQTVLCLYLEHLLFHPVEDSSLDHLALIRRWDPSLCCLSVYMPL